MNLTKWDPLSELEALSGRLNRIFGRPALPGATGYDMLKMADWTPSVDVSETDKEFVIKAEIPGVKKEDVKVTIEHGMLTIKGERKMEKEEKGKKFHRIERSYGSFVRSFRIPDGVDESKVKAEFKDGMMTIALPKSEKVKPRKIQVN